MSVLSEAAVKRSYMKADERRAQILTCARTVFAVRGFHGANIAAICKEAGIGRGTLYQYFDNKHDLFSAVLVDVAERIRAVLETRPPLQNLVPGEKIPARMIIAFSQGRLRKMLEAIFVDEATLRLIVRESRGLGGALEEAIQSVDAIVLGALVADLETAAKAGVIDCPDPRLTALFVLGGVEKMVLAALADDDGILLDVDSFGGEAQGAFGLADRIHAVRAKKPIVASVNENAMSGYFHPACAP